MKTAPALPEKPLRFPFEALQEADDLQTGFCIACGYERDSCEPDARNYHCDECKEDQVFGAQEIIMMGLVT